MGKYLPWSHLKPLRKLIQHILESNKTLEVMIEIRNKMKDQFKTEENSYIQNQIAKGHTKNATKKRFLKRNKLVILNALQKILYLYHFLY